MMTLDDYKASLKGAGPKLIENILARAAADQNIGFDEFVELSDFAYDGNGNYITDLSRNDDLAENMALWFDLDDCNIFDRLRKKENS